MQVGPEAEFFLFKLDAGGRADDRPARRRRLLRRRAPIDRGEDTPPRHRGHAARDGLPPRGVAPRGRDRPARDRLPARRRARPRADNLITFRWVVKVIAARTACTRPSWPKPIHGENGSGMHVNQSLSRGEENAFFDRTTTCSSRRRLRLHRGPDGAPAGDHRRREPDGQLVQAAAARLRGARSTSRGRPATARRRSACRPSAGARRGPSCARPTRPRTRTWPSRLHARGGPRRHQARAASRRRPSTATSTT